jgi:epoxyqueuosine reductase
MAVGFAQLLRIGSFLSRMPAGNECAGAITEGGHATQKCRQHPAWSREYVKTRYRFEGYGCGWCQVGVSCQSMMPVRAAREVLERGEPPVPLA